MTEKAKRRIHKFDFEKKGSHVALVGPVVGGAANGYTTLLTKSTKNISNELLEKASKVTVTMSITDFLRKFFNLYWEDSEILARALGFDTEEDENEPVDYEEWIDQQVNSISVMKQVFKAEDLQKALSELSSKDIEAMFSDQEKIEKAMSSLNEDVNSNENVNSKEDVPEMPTDNVEKIEKSQVEEMISKAISDVTSKLEEAQTIIKSYEQKEADLKKAARKEALKDAIKVEDHVEAIFKAMEGAEEEVYKEAIVALTAISKASESSDLFEEQGVDGGDEEVSTEIDNYTMKLMKAKYTK